jgi:LuxR family maltose regulon positive regulatory protein
MVSKIEIFLTCANHNLVIRFNPLFTDLFARFCPANAMPKTDALIHTKLYPPYIRLELVSRPRLLDQVAQGLRSPLTLVTAPAGFGKTTLVASSLAACGMPVGWLSLDKDDNQVDRFLIYLVAALQEANPSIGSEAAQLIEAVEIAPTTAVLTSLINDLDATGVDIVLVLDDYQFINSSAVHAAVAFLLEHCPKRFHLVIATRSDPPLPLTRLRARGQALQLRASDLAFSETEAAQFLWDVMGLSLEPAEVALLEERTEGWIAGLQMAALSMRDREDISGFIAGFSGTNRYILDYLMEEVLANQPQEIQEFLLCTSILERLTAPLCDAILVNAEGIAHHSGSILEYLEKTNLFLIPMNDDRTWFRYHQLFADLLRSRLSRVDIFEEKNLHNLAAHWFEQNDHLEEAIYHALAAQDFHHAARLIRDISEAVWLKSEYSKLIGWIKALPIDVVQDQPWLCVWCAWSLTQVGSLEEASNWIEAAETSVHMLQPDRSTVSTPSPEIKALEYEIATLRALMACLAEDYDQTIQLAAWVMNNPPPQDKKAVMVARCHALHSLSSMYFVVGDLNMAEESALETIRLSKEIGFYLRHVHAANKLAHVYRTRGQLQRSYQFLQDTLAFIDRQGFARYTVTHLLHCRMVDLLYEWNWIAEIEHLIDEYGLSDTNLQVPYVCADLYNMQARQLMLKNDLDGAQQALKKANFLIRDSYIWPAITRQTDALQVRLWLQTGNIQKAIAWSALPLEKDADRFPFLSEYRLFARARILLTQDRPEEALKILAKLRVSAETGKRYGVLIGIRGLNALALQSAGRAQEALAELDAVLELAEGENYVRTIIDEGQAMVVLLTQLAHAAPFSHRDYARRLVAEEDGLGPACENIPRMGSPTRQPIQKQILLVEPLSQRELEVLQIMALGKTNQEIAQQLIVSPGTVKAHTASIYRKLDAANRTEAVARARTLGILS